MAESPGTYRDPIAAVSGTSSHSCFNQCDNAAGNSDVSDAVSGLLFSLSDSR